MTSRNRKIFIFSIIGLIVLALIVWRLADNKKYLDAEKAKTITVKEVLIPVNYVVAGYQNIDDALIKTGTLIPYREADINAISGGKLVGVSFQLGSYVRQGQVLARVDNENMSLNMRQAELERDRAAKDVQRFTVLVQGNAATQMNLDDAKLRLDNANAHIRILQRQSTDNAIKAPISGEVTSKNSEQGEFVGPGSVLGHIVDVSRLKASVMVNESDVYSLREGTRVKVTTDIYPGVEYDGTITYISKQGDAAHNYNVEVTINNSRTNPLKAGTFINVNFTRPMDRAMLLVPRSAFIDGLKQPKLYIIRDSMAILQNVTVGKDLGQQIEVAAGLNEGDKVIVNGQINLSDSTKVNAQPVKTN